jgi:hypothetical protein
MMRRGVVIIPTYDRPEFLWLCLEHLLAADESSAKEIWLCEDIHADKPKSFTTQFEMLAVIRYFEKKFPFFRYTATMPHTNYGNSYNLIHALAEAWAVKAPLTYIVEDDVLITRDFFKWNEMVAQCHGYSSWVSCAGRLNRSLNFELNGRYEMDETCKDTNAIKRVPGAYISWATCFPWKSLNDFIPQFSNDTKFGPGVEQDMIIQTYMKTTGCWSIWPYVPRAYHMGWYSYHRDSDKNSGLYGTLEQRVEALRKIVVSPRRLREITVGPEIDAFQEIAKPADYLYLR